MYAINESTTGTHKLAYSIGKCELEGRDLHMFQLCSNTGLKLFGTEPFKLEGLKTPISMIKYLSLFWFV